VRIAPVPSSLRAILTLAFGVFDQKERPVIAIRRCGRQTNVVVITHRDCNEDGDTSLIAAKAPDPINDPNFTAIGNCMLDKFMDGRPERRNPKLRHTRLHPQYLFPIPQNALFLRVCHFCYK
jgi:hypothetical protein